MADTASESDAADVEPVEDDTSLDRSRDADVLPFPSNGRRTSEPSEPEPEPEPKLRDVIGDVLRDERRRQRRTLADVADRAAVSVPYLSEIERGTKEVSSDLLDAVTDSLGLTLVEVLERSVERLQVRAQRHGRIELRAA